MVPSGLNTLCTMTTAELEEQRVAACVPPVGHTTTQDRLVKSMINTHLVCSDPRELLRFGDVSEHISSALDTALNSH